MAIARKEVHEINTTVLEVNFRLATGIFLALISMILTVSLFLNLAGNDLQRQIIMVSMAIGMEAAKILTFRMGKGFRAISICLISISILASFGSALLVIESNRNTSMASFKAESQSSYQYKNPLIEAQSIDNQINVLIERLKNLPGDYISAGKEISANIDSLRTERAQTLTRMNQLQADTIPAMINTTSMFNLFSKISGVQEDIIILILLMFVAIILEISILALTKFPPTILLIQKDLSYSKRKMSHCPPDMSYSDSPNNADRTSREVESDIIPEISPQSPPTLSHAAIERDLSSEEFLRAMVDESTYPILRGRDATAQALGVPPYKAKIIVNQLIQEGKIKVEGKRLVMCRTIPRSNLGYPTSEEAKQKSDS
jgi:hypothetical protein